MRSLGHGGGHLAGGDGAAQPATWRELRSEVDARSKAPALPFLVQPAQRAARAASYQPSVADKVAWLTAMYAEEKPVGQTKVVQVPAELLPEGVASASYTPGSFLNDICNNLLGGGRVATRLTAEQMDRLKGQEEKAFFIMYACNGDDARRAMTRW